MISRPFYVEIFDQYCGVFSIYKFRTASEALDKFCTAFNNNPDKERFMIGVFDYNYNYIVLSGCLY